MFRIVLFGFSLIFFLIPATAKADTVHLRAGGHEGYERLVFDWGKRENYTTSQSTGQLTLKFSDGATLDDSAYKADPPKNVTGMKVVSSAPLTVSFTLAPGATTRDFAAETKVVVDVYAPPGKAQEKTADKKPEEKKEEEKSDKKKAEVKKQPEDKNAAKKIAAAPVENVLKQSIPDKQEQPAQPSKQVTEAPSTADLKKLQQEATTPVQIQQAPAPAQTAPPSILSKPNIITFSATKSTGLAVFERAGKVWMVTDHDDLVLSPSVTGPNAKDMVPPAMQDIPGGKAYIFPKLGGRAVQGQAGGLLWRVVIAPQDIYLDSVKPSREDDNGDDPGGGKIIWDLQDMGRVLDVPDPVSGKTLKVVTVNSAKYMSGLPQDYVEFETLPTPVGLVVLPKVDDLTVEITRRGVVVSRPGGLHLMPEKNVSAARSFAEAEEKKKDDVQVEKKLPERRIFDFDSWQMGGLQVLEKNRMTVLSSLGGLPKDKQIEGLLSLAKMHLANGLWAEANGFLDFAVDEMPELGQNPEYMALNGASLALGRISDLAFQQLNDKALDPYPEIGYWKAYVLADLEDWQQAGQVLPADVDILGYYPEVLLSRLGLVLAEVALRSGKMDEADKILKLVEDHGGKLVYQQQAELDYLHGELARQRNKPDDALKFWKPLTTGKDPMYRARAGLAITRLQYEKKQITAVQAIDNLERLRYAWRGDELEALINYWLGKVYFDTGDYIKGLNIMRDAATFSEGTDLGEKIKTEMMATFADVFTGPALEKISGPDSAALYDAFSSLIPAGDKGDQIAEKLADHLADKELFERAEQLFQIQMGHRQGFDAFRIGMKLAAIQLLDDKSADALTTLQKAKDVLDKQPLAQQNVDDYQQIALLKARALSQERRPDQALALLHDMPRSKAVNKLRADIAWKAGYWPDAAESLGDVITDEDISLTRPLTPEHAGLIMQRSVALNLANDRIALANMREKYGDAMKQTDKAKVFEVITRPRQSGALADRDTLMGIVSEVDLFKEFLDNFKKGDTSAATDATAPAATPAATPATAPGTTPTAPATTPPATPPAGQ